MHFWGVSFTASPGHGRAAIFAALLSGLILFTSILAVAPARASASSNMHVCEGIGSDGTTDANICTDLVVQSLGGNRYEAYAQTEAYCVLRSNGAYTQCADIGAFNETIKSNSSGTAVASDGPFGCSAADGASACSSGGRNYLFGDTAIYGTGCMVNVWALTKGGGLTGIELPSGQWEWQRGNLATPHVNVGNC
jgi:hypothetical protein